MDNPYKPPASAVRDPPPAPRAPRSPVVAVLAGTAIDLGGSLLSGIVIGIVYVAMLAAGGKGTTEIQTTLTQPDPTSAYFIVSAVTGYCFSMLGGYVCARLVRRRERRVTGVMAAISGIVGFALGGIGAQFGSSDLIFFTLIQVACVMLGGELGRRRNAAQARAAGVATAA